ncbi:hypothetical protein MJO28_005574 [Puccinia striiformis f. sp. tritici]|uniref:Secreted protein n=4 Tax=Puccinia striiformis TaxID=27350 RepID=A0A0L0V1H0_9BASI|nr:hypothetical protein MJO28_005574 [Puccinia striiformis f. sp. tritici]KAI9612007.1 hypothetical protein H4Q26_008097 [Puccinia striiformis f. sp. tritici PST-130]KNE93105.1 hypothetical protein PSTG_13494 [Puccinia striiformis f. sp. tritici PST-78]POV99518.1 hypothetical protein PSHT_13483 [Puccinia striiformis]KAI7960543.1 hypothetical protein MJO29_005611 [Puccinia striiformis f. sp. tritici]
MQVSMVVKFGFILLQGVLGNPISPHDGTRLRSDDSTAPLLVDIPKFKSLVDGQSAKRNEASKIANNRMAH